MYLSSKFAGKLTELTFVHNWKCSCYAIKLFTVHFDFPEREKWINNCINIYDLKIIPQPFLGVDPSFSLVKSVQ